MAFSFGVEMLNMTMHSQVAKRKAHIVELNEPVLSERTPSEKEKEK